ncbi:MFS transporter [Cardinium endosymbiont of Culicoides punctatus]|uniref:MFS transporter n=1 Tax=Cardinium endosymbiont of Culicoides punctatus TaxID=2304601 RepID=UPI001058F0F3|nr:MFS transporter [Cardinium endosymbiont of Culicoides punctatus]TDG95787.1 hypothetical protein CCPUN_00720 [Cardinium endosymbiont of Culicoides punctatus]
MWIKIIYLIGICAMNFSSILYDFTFAITAFHLTDEAKNGAIVYSVGYLAEILVSMGFGGFLDAYSKRTLFTIAMISKVFLFIFVFIFFNKIRVSLAAISIAAFLVDLISHVTHLTNLVSIATCYHGEERIKFNGLVLTISGIMRISGPILASMFLSYFSQPSYMLLIATLFQFIAMCAYYYIMPLMEREKTIPFSTQSVSHALRGTVIALQLIFADLKWIKLLLIHVSTATILAIATLLLFPLFSKIYHISDVEIGVLRSIGAIGSVAVGVVLGSVFTTKKLSTGISITVFIAGLSLSLFSFYSGFYSAMCLVFLFQSSCTLFFRTASLYFQTFIPNEVMGSWWAAIDAIERLFSLGGILAGGYIFDISGGELLYNILGACLIVISILWFLRNRSLA